MLMMNPLSCSPPHSVSRPDDVIELANQFVDSGWDMTKPILIGYYIGCEIQLLTGTHRRAAAIMAGIKIPVIIKDYLKVRAAYGNLELWKELLNEKS